MKYHIPSWLSSIHARKPSRICLISQHVAVGDVQDRAKCLKMRSSVRHILRMLSANIHEIMQVLFRACNRSLSAAPGSKQSREVPRIMPENLPRVGSALLVRDEEYRILLGKRNKDPQRGCWVIPGGKIHPFETISEAGVRELREETGLSVAVGDPFRVYEIVNPPNEHRLIVYSWATVVGGVPKPSDDLSEVDFFRPDEIANLPLTPLVRQVLHDAQILEHPAAFTNDERSRPGRVRKKLQRRGSPGTGALDFQGSIAIR